MSSSPKAVRAPGDIPAGIMVLKAFLWVVSDYVVINAIAWLWYVIVLALHGWRVDLFIRFGILFISTMGVASVWLFNSMASDPILGIIRRHGYMYSEFTALYNVLDIVIAYPLSFILIYGIKFIYTLGDDQWPLATWGGTLFCQMTFLVYGINASLCGGNMLKVKGIHMTLCLFVVTWIVWIVFSDKVMGNGFMDSGAVRPEGWWSYNIFGSVVQTLVMTNLMFFSVLRPAVQEFTKPEWPVSQRIANLLPFVLLYAIVQWIVAFLANYVAWPTALFTQLCNGAWNLVNISWVAYQVLGYRLTPVLWPRMTRKGDGVSPSICGVVLYFLVMFILGIVTTAAFYFFFHFATWPVIFVRLLNFTDPVPMYDRLDFTFAFAMGSFCMSYYGNHFFSITKEEKAERKAAAARDAELRLRAIQDMAAV